MSKLQQILNPALSPKSCTAGFRNVRSSSATVDIKQVPLIFSECRTKLTMSHLQIPQLNPSASVPSLSSHSNSSDTTHSPCSQAYHISPGQQCSLHGFQASTSSYKPSYSTPVTPPMSLSFNTSYGPVTSSPAQIPYQMTLNTDRSPIQVPVDVRTA